MDVHATSRQRCFYKLWSCIWQAGREMSFGPNNPRVDREHEIPDNSRSSPLHDGCRSADLRAIGVFGGLEVVRKRIMVVREMRRNLVRFGTDYA
jgi:hypothetical protein